MGLIKLLHPHLLYENPHFSFLFGIASFWQILICFVLLGVCASDFLCPNVASITDSHQSLRKTTGSAGVLMAVILSWCNSSPDLFSNLMSWTGSSEGNYNIAASLSIGEVLGACGIILCVVIGSIFFLMDGIQIEINYSQRKNILFDLSYTLAALLMLLYISVKNSVSIWNCFSMLSIYSCYLFHKYRNARIDSLDQQDEEENSTIGESIINITSAAGIIDPNIRPNLLSAMDFNTLLSMLEQSKGSNAELISVQAPDENLHDTIFFQRDSQRPLTEPIPITTHENPTREVQSSPGTFQPYYDNPEEHPDEAEEIVRQEYMTATSQIQAMDQKNLESTIKKLLGVALPHLKNFRQKSALDAVLSVFVVPFVLIFRISCPQANELASYNQEYGKYQYKKLELMLSLVQGIISPFLTFFLISALFEQSFSIVWMIPFAIVITLLYETIMFYKSLLKVNKFSLIGLNANNESDVNNEQDRRQVEKTMNLLRFVFLGFGIVNSILWISIIANAVIEILEIYQKITGISPAILGLTVFAWGNSISDLISNIAMCKLYKKIPHNEDNVSLMATKFFLIACSSCIGGVLLNSMGGIGISGSIAMLFIHKNTGNWWFQRQTSLITTGSQNYKFLVSSFILICQCLILLLIFGGTIRIREYAATNMKRIGIFMCSLWIVTTILNVCLEIASK